MGKGVAINLSSLKSKNPKNLCQLSFWSKNKIVNYIDLVFKENLRYTHKKLYILRLE